MVPRDRAQRADSTTFIVACVLRVIAMFCLSSLAPAADHSVDANYTLKLEYEMSRQGGAQASAEELSPAVLFGITNLNDRATAADNRVKAVELDNQKWKEELFAREKLISELEQALGSQEQTIKLLESKVLQPQQPLVRLPPAQGRTWGPAGWNPGELRWDDVRNFAHFPTAAERALTVTLILLLIYALYLRLRSHNNRPKLDNNRDTPGAQRATGTPSTRREELEPKSMVAERQLHKRPDDLDTSAPPLQLESEPTPPEPHPASAKPQETAPPTLRLASGGLMQEPTPASDASMHPPNQPPISPAPPRPKRKRADPATLREVDALIAFEHFDDAAELLAQAMLDNPDNPEYRLRSLYILNTLGDHERIASEQSVLRAIMDGPMSDTLGRVIETGRGLLPDDPLFEPKDAVPSSIPQPPSPSDDAITLDDGTIDEFNELTFRSDDIELGDEPPKTN